MKFIARTIFNVILLGIVSGCVSMQQMQNGMDEIDLFWGEVNQKIISSKGSKVYSKEVSKCLDAAKKTALQLGFSITEESNNSLILRALTPAPFTKDEYRDIKDIEEPMMQAMVANHVGKFYSKLFTIDDKGLFYIIVKINISQNSAYDGSLVQITFQLYPKNDDDMKGFVYGLNPPPEAVRKGLDKWWNAFESNLETTQR